MCSCALDAAADRDDALGLREIDGLLGFAERRLGLLTNRGRIDGGGDRARPAPARCPSSPRRRGTRRSETSRDAAPGPSSTTSALTLPWNIGRVNTSAAAVRLDADAVGRDRAIEPRGQLAARSRASDTCAANTTCDGRFGGDERGERLRRSRRPCRRRAPRARARSLRRRRPPPAPSRRRRRSRPARRSSPARPSAARRRRPPSDARLSAPSCCSAMTRIMRVTHHARASSRSTRTSSFAASAGEPAIIRVCFAFSGT